MRLGGQYWFGQASSANPRLPLIVTPSSIEPVPSETGEVVRIGSRITLGAAWIGNAWALRVGSTNGLQLA